MKYPLVLEVTKNAKGKIQCICAETGVDYAREVAWITKQNAIRYGRDLYKETKNSKFQQIEKIRRNSNSTKSVTSNKSTADEPSMMMQFVHQDAIDKKPADLIMPNLTWKVVCRNIVRGKNILLTGPSGCGKSQTAFAAAAAMGRELFYINLGATQDPRGALIGNTHFAKETGTFFSESAFVKAIQTPNTVILLDEVSRAHPEAWNILMTVLDPKQRYLRLDEAVNSPTVKVADGVSFIGTANIGVEFTSTRVLDRALLDRFQMIEIPYLDAKDERRLIEFLYPKLKNAEESKAIAEIVAATRDEMKSDAARISTPISTRVGLEMAELVVDGFTLVEAAEIAVYPFYSEMGGLQSERTFIRQLVQKYINDETDNTLTDDPTKKQADSATAI